MLMLVCPVAHSGVIPDIMWKGRSWDFRRRIEIEKNRARWIGEDRTMTQWELTLESHPKPIKKELTTLYIFTSLFDHTHTSNLHPF